MANKEGHRGFGNVRELPSGRWQARYPGGPDGLLRNAPRTFASKREAETWLSITEAQIVTGEWTDPERAKIHLADYATKWINERPGLRPNTKALYEWLWNKHIGPRLGEVQLGKITTALVRGGALTCSKTACLSQSQPSRIGCCGRSSTRPLRRIASCRATRAGCGEPTRRAPLNGRC